MAEEELAQLVQGALTRWLQEHSGVQATAPNYHYDMLNDAARNQAYNAAIQAAVTTLGDDALVLDIGSGSGLLAMLAAQTSAQHVWTCEADPTLAAATKAVVCANGLDRRVHVVSKFSHDLTVSLSGDLPGKVDVVVTEIFDSVLLGEGILPTMVDAVDRLLAPGGVVVPAGACITGMLINAPILAQSVGQSAEARGLNEAADGQSFVPFQLHAGNALASGALCPLSAEVALLDFDFSRPQLRSSQSLSLPVTASGTAHGFLFWWTLNMAPGIQLSTDPRPAGSLPARDHWRQAACIFTHPREVEAGEILEVLVGHEPEMPWMVLKGNAVNRSTAAHLVVPHHHLAASLHFSHCETTIARLTAMRKQLKLQANSQVVCIGDNACITTAFPGATRLYYSPRCSRTDDATELLLQPHIGTHGLPSYPTSEVENHTRVGDCLALVAEPFFYDMRAPGSKVWLFDELLRFWQLANSMRVQQVAPSHCKVVAQPMACPHLFARRQPVAIVEGVDLAAFNTAAARTEGLVVLDLEDFAADLTPSGEAVVVGELEYISTSLGYEGTRCVAELKLTERQCHAVALWCDVTHNGDLVSTCRRGEPGAKQALVFLPNMTPCGSSLTVQLALRTRPICGENPGAIWDALRGGVHVSYQIENR